MESFEASTSSSTSKPSTRGWMYDVFLSFRGKDTRNNFIDHLYGNLVQRGIHVFKDNEMLGGGKPISPELVKAIEESRVAVVVFSKNYAESSWCLEELEKIMDCHYQMGQKVIPVFYLVNPSDVCGQRRDFAFAFQQHGKKFSKEMGKVIKWRRALTAAANLSGHHISSVSGGEYAIVKKIIEEILCDMQPIDREDNIIGIESHMERLISLLIIEETDKVRMIGILGMGGIGKTTIAKALFKRISYKFQGSCFIKDVRQNSTSDKDLCALQEKILNDILGVRHGFSIQDPEYGANMIHERFCNKKVLLILDDVKDVKQLEFLAETHEWFGPGSRIIITTRDEHLLSDANDIYKPALLRMDQAVELFCRHAFRGHNPPDGYEELSGRAICYSGRLPLALKVLGSFFRGRKAAVWPSALDRLAKIPDRQIFEKLKLSFDDLNVFEQKIFLDVACFFKGKEVKDVTRILESFGFDAVIGISVLTEKCLVTVSKENLLGMHDLVQDMGWKIVRESTPNSRLWQLEEIRDVINKNRELEAIEAIVEPWSGQKVGFSADIFESMKNLRLLHVYLQFTSDQPTVLPDELRWLCWSGYPYSSLQLADMRKLVGLDMYGNDIEYLWKGRKNMPNLKFVHLEGSGSLTRFPDVSGAPNIERFILTKSDKLVDVDESLGFLKRLIYLDLSYCEKLKCLPSRMETKSLETLKLYGCMCLERIPEFSPCMVKLTYICLGDCKRLKDLPSSIKYLSNLSVLLLNSCGSLKSIPNSICEVKCLMSLHLDHCWRLVKLPHDFVKLEELHLKGAESFNFCSLTNLCFLRKLDFSGTPIRKEEFPKSLHGLSALEELDLSYSAELLELPASISHLSRLKHLNLKKCRQLQTLNGLPSGVQVLEADGCISLEKIEDLSEDHECLYKISLVGCQKLLKDEKNERYLDNLLKQSFLQKAAAVDCGMSISIPGSKIPSWFKEQQPGRKITLKLPPKWQTQIMGFAICGSFKGDFSPQVYFRFENDDIFVSKEKDENENENEKDNENLWICYVPFSFFKKMTHDDNDDFEHEDWSHIIEGNPITKVSLRFTKVARCGARVVYKEDVESIQQTKPLSIAYYQKWSLTNWSTNSINCK